MEVTQQCVVALTWTLKDTLGEELDVLDEPVEFLIGGDDLFKRIEEALQGHGIGTKLDLHLEPEEAFGEMHKIWTPDGWWKEFIDRSLEEGK